MWRLRHNTGSFRNGFRGEHERTNSLAAPSECESAPHPRRSLSTFVGMWRCDGSRLRVVIAARGAGWRHCAGIMRWKTRREVSHYRFIVRIMFCASSTNCSSNHGFLQSHGWLRACLSGFHPHPLNVGCTHSPEYSSSKVGAAVPPAIPSSDRNALKG